MTFPDGNIAYDIIRITIWLCRYHGFFLSLSRDSWFAVSARPVLIRCGGEKSTIKDVMHSCHWRSPYHWTKMTIWLYQVCYAHTRHRRIDVLLLALLSLLSVLSCHVLVPRIRWHSNIAFLTVCAHNLMETAMYALLRNISWWRVKASIWMCLGEDEHNESIH